MKRAFLALGLAVALVAPAWADYFDGLTAYGRGDYATAIREWTPLAEQGHAAAQFFLGVMYNEGQGVLQDYTEAAKWYRKAAEQGDLGAQVSLGVMYNEGQGVLPDYTEAAKWFRRAAEQGDARAAPEGKRQGREEAPGRWLNPRGGDRWPGDRWRRLAGSAEAGMIGSGWENEGVDGGGA